MLEMFVLIAGIAFVGAILLFIVVKSCYKICPSDKILVVNGAGSGRKRDAADDTGGAKIYQGGGAFVIPGLQTCQYITLAPMSSDINLQKALTSNNILVDVPTQITFAIDTESVTTLRKAVKYFSSFTSAQIVQTVSDVVVGGMRSVISSMSVEELISNRDKFYTLVDETLTSELSKMGLKIINRNIRDISDHNNYIRTLGQKASEQVLQRANIDVAEQRKIGEIGTAERDRDRTVAVAETKAQQEIQQSLIERKKQTEIAQAAAQQTIDLANAKAQQDVGTSLAATNQQIAINEQQANQEISVVEARTRAQVRTATLETEAAELSRDLRIRAATAESEASCAEIVASTTVAHAQKEQRVAELSAETLAQTEVERQEAVVRAEMSAQEITIKAEADAAASLRLAEAQAQGLRKLLDAKADGYKKIVAAAGGDANAAANLLLIEQFKDIAEIQVQALKGITIDSVTLIGGGNGSEGGSPISAFVQDYVSALPGAHALAQAAGINLPNALGNTGVAAAEPRTVGATLSDNQ